jgi:hypothetical protein
MKNSTSGQQQVVQLYSQEFYRHMLRPELATKNMIFMPCDQNNANFDR